MADEYPALRRFLLPEKEISLKLIFDNARNYLIIGAFVAMARWFQNGKATIPSLWYSSPVGTNHIPLLVWLCFGVAGVLFWLNATQSYYIGSRILVTALNNAETDAMRAKPPAHIRLSIRVLAWGTFTVFLAVGVLLLNLATYVVWFSAVGSGR